MRQSENNSAINPDVPDDGALDLSISANDDTRGDLASRCFFTHLYQASKDQAVNPLLRSLDSDDTWRHDLAVVGH